MWNRIWRVEWQVRVLTEPIQDENGWSYKVKLIAKLYKLFGFTIYRKETDKL